VYIEAAAASAVKEMSRVQLSRELSTPVEPTGVMKRRRAGSSCLRVGIIGSGEFAVACHIPGVQAHAQAEVTAICGRNHERTQAVADRFGIPSICSDYRELCTRPDIDAVMIVTPNAFHAEQAVTAFQHGKHVLCEKPMARTMAEARIMLEAAVASGKIHQVNFMYRHLYGVRELRRRVQVGDIGEPYLIRVQYDGWRGLNRDWKIGWRERRDLSGGGELLDHGSHLFDIARFVFGRIEHVTGFLHRIPRKQPDVNDGMMTDVETDDVAAAWFRHACGVRGQWFASRATPRSEENGWLEVVGPEGALRASLSRGTVDRLQMCRPMKPSWESLPLPAEASDGTPHCLTSVVNRFVDLCIGGSFDPGTDSTFTDGFAAQQGIDAVMQANDTLAWVPLSDFSANR